MLVKVIVTENGSPAKYEDWEGVTTTRTAESTPPELGPGIFKEVQDNGVSAKEGGAAIGQTRRGIPYTSE